MTVLIPRNTTIPTRKSETFSTASDNQTSVEVHVLQGERSMAAGNRTLGKFHLVGIPPAPRGVPQIEVTFDIDANGIVNVSAKDMATGKQQAITITASSGMSEDEIKRMVKDAEVNVEDDKRKREQVEARNQLDTLLYNTEKTLNEHRSKLGEAEVKALENAIAEGKRALESENAEGMKKAAQAIMQASHKMAEILYQQHAQPQPGAGQPGAQPSGTNGKGKAEGEVIEAEYEDTN
jgi:molecular chaperone DnaK